MELSGRLRILWLTNLPAPYRFPIWDRMSESVDLRVVFLLGPKNWRNWTAPSNPKWSFNFLSLKSIHIKEFDLIPSFSDAPKILSDIDVAIIGGWENPLYIVTILIAQKRGIPIIQFYESHSRTHSFNRGPIARIRKWILSKPNRFICLGPESRLALIEMGVEEKNILSIPNPVDSSRYFPASRQRISSPSRGHRFLFVGQLIERKNIHSLLQAFAEVRELGDSLTIVGEGHLGPELKKLSEGYGLSTGVIFQGQVEPDSLIDIYANSDSLVLPSTKEVWGLVINEALLSGLHVVVSENCGVANLVKEMKGVYVTKADPSSLADGLKRSRGDWRGVILDPEIRKFNAINFADQTLKLAMSLL